MALTRKQKNFINANFEKLTSAEISTIIKAKKTEVDKYLSEFSLEKKEKFKKSISLPEISKDSQVKSTLRENKSNKPSSNNINSRVFQNYQSLFVVIKNNFIFFLGIFFYLFFLYAKGFNGILLSDEVIHYYEKFENNLFNFSLIPFGHLNALTSLNYVLFGLNGAGHRITTLLVHFVNIVLFFYIFRNFFSDKVLKIAVLIIACHSLLVEPIIWVAANTYVYINFLYILSFVFSFLFSKSSKIYYYFLSIVPIAILTLSGAHGNFAPIVYTTFNFFLLNRNWKKEILYSGWLYVLIPIFIFSNTSGIVSRVDSLTTGPFIPKFIQTLPFTVAKSTELVFFPWNLTFFHEETMYPLYYLFSQLFTLFFIAFVVTLFFKNEKYFGLLALGLAVPIYIFSPIQISWFVAERYMYFTVFVFSIFASLGVLYINKYLGKLLAYGLLASYFLLFTYRSYARMEDWQSAVLLWSQNSVMAPDSYRVRNNLGDSYAVLNDFVNAKIQYQEAIKRNPNAGQAQLNYGVTLIKEGKFQEAEQYIKSAIEVNPNLIESYIQLGVVYANIKQYDRALQIIDAISLDNIPGKAREEVMRVRSSIEGLKNENSNK